MIKAAFDKDAKEIDREKFTNGYKVNWNINNNKMLFMILDSIWNWSYIKY